MLLCQLRLSLPKLVQSSINNNLNAAFLAGFNIKIPPYYGDVIAKNGENKQKCKSVKSKHKASTDFFGDNTLLG